MSTYAAKCGAIDTIAYRLCIFLRACVRAYVCVCVVETVTGKRLWLTLFRNMNNFIDVKEGKFAVISENFQGDKLYALIGTRVFLTKKPNVVPT